MTTIAIIGLGTMGLGIAQTFAAAGFQVLATDMVQASRASALARLGNALQPRLDAGKLTQADLDALISRITVVEGVSALAAADLVIEAVIESLPVKQELFAALEQIVSAETVLATNTSSLSVAAIAAPLTHPERVLGLHFFNPAPVMKLVELVSWTGTDAKALALARSVAEAAQKTVIACPDRPGFIVNRCARPYYGEALAMVEEGRSPAEIDAALQAAGYRLGPFALIDLVGADINLAATESLAAAMEFHPRYYIFDRLRQQVAAGDLGRKTGRGFVHPGAATDLPADAKVIVARIEAALVNEIGWLLAEGGTSAEGIDTALKLGLNFPRGPWQSRPADVLETLVNLEAAAPAHLKGRYAAAPALLQG